jgi:hypothetical protein
MRVRWKKKRLIGRPQAGSRWPCGSFDDAGLGCLSSKHRFPGNHGRKRVQAEGVIRATATGDRKIRRFGGGTAAFGNRPLFSAMYVSALNGGALATVSLFRIGISWLPEYCVRMQIRSLAISSVGDFFKGQTTDR